MNSERSSHSNTNMSMFSLIKELELPYIKVDNSLKQLHWSDSFSYIMDVNEADFDQYTLAELAATDLLIEFIYGQLNLSKKYKQIIKNVYEHEEEVIHVTIFPKTER